MADSSYSNSDLLGLAGKADARFRGIPMFGSGESIILSASPTANTKDLPIDCHVMLLATKECWVRFSPDGTDPALQDADMYLVANVPYLLRLGKTGSNYNRRINALQSGSGGFLRIIPMTAE